LVFVAIVGILDVAASLLAVVQDDLELRRLLLSLGVGGLLANTAYAVALPILRALGEA